MYRFEEIVTDKVEDKQISVISYIIEKIVEENVFKNRPAIIYKLQGKA